MVQHRENRGSSVDERPIHGSIREEWCIVFSSREVFQRPDKRLNTGSGEVLACAVDVVRDIAFVKRSESSEGAEVAMKVKFLGEELGIQGCGWMLIESVQVRRP